MDHDEVFKVIWMNEKVVWIDNVKNDVLFIDFGYARYSKGMEKITRFGMKYSSTSLSLGLKYFYSLRYKIDQPICTYMDKYVKWFVTECITGSTCTAFIQHYKSKKSVNIFRIVSEKKCKKRHL